MTDYSLRRGPPHPGLRHVSRIYPTREGAFAYLTVYLPSAETDASPSADSSAPPATTVRAQLDVVLKSKLQPVQWEWFLEHCYDPATDRIRLKKAWKALSAEGWLGVEQSQAAIRAIAEPFELTIQFDEGDAITFSGSDSSQVFDMTGDYTGEFGPGYIGPADGGKLQPDTEPSTRREETREDAAEGTEAAFSKILPPQMRISSDCTIICRTLYSDLEIYYQR